MDIYSLVVGFITGIGFMAAMTGRNKPKETKCDCDGCNMEHGYQPCHKKPIGPPNTKLNGEPLDYHKCNCGDNEPDFSVEPPKVDMGDYRD
jgi:hypothetical protein